MVTSFTGYRDDIFHVRGSVAEREVSQNEKFSFCGNSLYQGVSDHLKASLEAIFLLLKTSVCADNSQNL